MGKFYFIIILVVTLIACQQQKYRAIQSSMFSHPGMIILDSEMNIDTVVIFEQDVTIYPGAYITTSKRGKIIFSSKVNILGESQVFDCDINLEFARGTISELSPTWFGAKGFDESDDTKAFQKTIAVAVKYDNTVVIKVPIGRFIIAETLVLDNVVPNESAINLLGEAISTNTIYGSCLQWRGPDNGTLMLVKNNALAKFENIEFTSYSNTHLKHDIEFRPYVNQVTVQNCSFSGCKGEGSANINLNIGNNAQVSEIFMENCIFRGLTLDNKLWLTPSAIKGGTANTKNFYITGCSFLGYTVAAIDIDFSDIIQIQNCTFANNEVDIFCSICNSWISSNYSEHSRSFFKSGVSHNMSYTTMMNNYFDGNPDDDFVIRDGSGSLVLLNNSFGGTGWTDPNNKVKWSNNELSSIYSNSNFFRNDSLNLSPFLTRNNLPWTDRIQSINDKIGTGQALLRDIVIPQKK